MALGPVINSGTDNSNQIAAYSGPRGATGPTGPAGAASTVPGPVGPQGDQGAAGLTGADGVAGDQFYLGAWDRPPATDNYGRALTTGMWYFNTSDSLVYIFDGSNFIVSSAIRVPSASTEYHFILQSGEDTISGTDENGNTLEFGNENYVALFEGHTADGKGTQRLPAGDDPNGAYRLDREANEIILNTATTEETRYIIQVGLSEDGASPGGVTAFALEDISAQFDGAEVSFQLRDVAGDVQFPAKPEQLIIRLDHVVQDPTIEYSINGANIVFPVAPPAGTHFAGLMLQGTAVSMNGVMIIAPPTPTAPDPVANMLWLDNVNWRLFTGVLDDGAVLVWAELGVYSGGDASTITGMPAGGANEEVLQKQSGVDYDADWVNALDAGAYTG